MCPFYSPRQHASASAELPQGLPFLGGGVFALVPTVWGKHLGTHLYETRIVWATLRSLMAENAWHAGVGFQVELMFLLRSFAVRRYVCPVFCAQHTSLP